MRWVSILLFAALAIFGIVRLDVRAESTAVEAHSKSRTLQETHKLLRGRGVTPPQESVDAQKQAEQTASNADQNAGTLKSVQIALTALVIVLTAIVLTMLLRGKPVDNATKTFTFGCMTTIITYWFYVPK